MNLAPRFALLIFVTSFLLPKLASHCIGCCLGMSKFVWLLTHSLEATPQRQVQIDPLGEPRILDPQ